MQKWEIAEEGDNRKNSSLLSVSPVHYFSVFKYATLGTVRSQLISTK
jgi:hypothetical protein